MTPHPTARPGPLSWFTGQTVPTRLALIAALAALLMAPVLVVVLVVRDAAPMSRSSARATCEEAWKDARWAADRPALVENCIRDLRGEPGVVPYESLVD